MGARWLAAMLFVAAVSHADEVGSATPHDAPSEPASHLRTFIGGFASGAFLVSRIGVFTVSPLGVAVDVGVNFRDHLAVFGQFRLSTMLLFNHAQLSASVEWSLRQFSLSLGAGAGLIVSARPDQGLVVAPAVSVPLGLGFTFAEERVGAALRSTRLNLEFAMLISPAVGYYGPGFGGSVGLSVGSLTR